MVVFAAETVVASVVVGVAFVAEVEASAEDFAVGTITVEVEEGEDMAEEGSGQQRSAFCYQHSDVDTFSYSGGRGGGGIGYQSGGSRSQVSLQGHSVLLSGCCQWIRTAAMCFMCPAPLMSQRDGNIYSMLLGFTERRVRKLYKGVPAINQNGLPGDVRAPASPR